MDGSTRSGSEDGREDVRDDNSKSGDGRRSFEEFDVKIGLRPLLFIAVLDLISRNTVVKDAMSKLQYADDLAMVTNDTQVLQEILDE